MLENESREMVYTKENLDITKYVKAHLGIPDVSDLNEEQLDSSGTPVTPIAPPTEDDFDYIKLISNGAYG